jgi:hypothetical protein
VFLLVILAIAHAIDLLLSRMMSYITILLLNKKMLQSFSMHVFHLKNN